MFSFLKDLDDLTVESREETEKVARRMEQNKQSQKRKRSRLDDDEAATVHETDAAQHKVSRLGEDEKEAEERREANAAQMAKARQLQCEEETAERRAANAAQMANARQLECQDETEEKRAANAAQMANARQLECEDETDERRAKDAEKNLQSYRKRMIATMPIIDEQKVKPSDLGPMNHVCSHCQARHFKGERAQDKQFNTCCAKGKVILPEPGHFPDLLKALITQNHPKSNEFLLQIRNYNSALAFGAQIVTVPGRGPKVFKIHGQIYHNTSAVRLRDETSVPKYSQLYFMDSTQANEHRTNLSANKNCDKHLMEQLDTMLCL